VAATGTPTLVMTYWNPVERWGVERFAADLAAAGGAGLITPDLIPDEADEWIDAAEQHDLDRVFLVAPSSPTERIALTARACRGFIYATSVMGVTGARQITSTAAPALVGRVRAETDLPVGVGLGVSDGAQAAEVAAFADAVIVGSAFVRPLLDTADREAGIEAIRALTADLADGVRA
jgi:tryptophan synthase alpha chain